MTIRAESFSGNLERVRERIAQAQAASGHKGDVTIVAVTKGHDATAVSAAMQAGLFDIGENRVQEALRKREAMPDPSIRWHLIGHLQTNKAKHVAGAFALVHSVDSLRVAAALAAAVPAGSTQSVLLQVNVAGESQKTGCDAAEAPTLVQQIAEMPALRLRGLMTMAPFTDDEQTQRRVFAALRALRDRLTDAARPLPELSMGMSGDYPAAIAEGATIIRLGTVLFGERS